MVFRWNGYRMSEKTCSSHQAPKNHLLPLEGSHWSDQRSIWVDVNSRTRIDFEVFKLYIRNIILIFACASCQHRCFSPRENHKPSIRTQPELMTVDKKMREEKRRLSELVPYVLGGSIKSFVWLGRKESAAKSLKSHQQSIPGRNALNCISLSFGELSAARELYFGFLIFTQPVPIQKVQSG